MYPYDKTLVRYGEIALKSRRVRSRFEYRLINNIRHALKAVNLDFKIRNVYGRIIIDGFDQKALDKLKRVFGIVSFSPCIHTTSDLDYVKESALALSDFKGSFAVRCNRTGKHEYSSKDVEKIIGAAIVEKTKCKVDLGKPDNTVGIDIRDKDAYIYSKSFRGPGGLPLDTQGRVACLIKDKSGVLASWFVMRRGCGIIPIFCKVNKKEQENFSNFLFGWACGSDLKFIEIKSLKDIKKTMEENKCQVLVTGDYDLKNIQRTKFTTFMPLVGKEKEDIESLYKLLEQ